MIEILCTSRFIKYTVQKCSCSLCATSRRIRVQRDGNENDRICPWSWAALNHCDGPWTVDFVLDGITDYAYSLWAALYVWYELNNYILSTYKLTNDNATTTNKMNMNLTIVVKADHTTKYNDAICNWTYYLLPRWEMKYLIVLNHTMANMMWYLSRLYNADIWHHSCQMFSI
jgi:hypothetical protein